MTLGKMIALAVFIGLVVNELHDISPWAAGRLVRWSAHLRYDNLQRAHDRADEFVALIATRPGKLLKLACAVVFAAAALAFYFRRAVLPTMARATGKGLRSFLLCLLATGAVVQRRPRLAGPTLMLGAWWLTTSLLRTDAVPPPGQVAETFVRQSGYLAHEAGTTVLLGLVSLLIAIAAGLLLTLILATIRRSVWWPMRTPTFTATLQIAPMMAIAIVPTYGIMLELQYAVIGLVLATLLAFIPILHILVKGPIADVSGAFDAGLLLAQQSALERSRTAYRGPLTVRARLVLAITRLFCGAKISVSAALFGAFFVEALLGSRGLGALFIRSAGLTGCSSTEFGFCGHDPASADLPLLYAASITATITAFCLICAFVALERLARRQACKLLHVEHRPVSFLRTI